MNIKRLDRKTRVRIARPLVQALTMAVSQLGSLIPLAVVMPESKAAVLNMADLFNDRQATPAEVHSSVEFGLSHPAV